MSCSAVKVALARPLPIRFLHTGNLSHLMHERRFLIPTSSRLPLANTTKCPTQDARQLPHTTSQSEKKFSEQANRCQIPNIFTGGIFPKTWLSMYARYDSRPHISAPVPQEYALCTPFQPHCHVRPLHASRKKRGISSKCAASAPRFHVFD